MVALFYMLAHPVLTQKHTEDTKKIFQSFHYTNLDEILPNLALPHVRRQNLHGLMPMAQLKMKIFLGIVLEVTELVLNIENDCTGKGKRCKIHENSCWSKSEKDNMPMSKEK